MFHIKNTASAVFFVLRNKLLVYILNISIIYLESKIKKEKDRKVMIMCLSKKAAKATQVSMLKIENQVVGISLRAVRNNEALRVVGSIREKGANKNNVPLSGLRLRIHDDQMLVQIKSISETIELCASNDHEKQCFMQLKSALKNPRKMVSVFGKKTAETFESAILQKNCDYEQIVPVAINCTVH